MNRLFAFVARRLRWLIRVPFFPQIFDSMLLAWTCLTRRSRLAAMTTLEKALGNGVGLAVHRFGGTEFLDARGRPLGHVHGHGLLDVRLNRKQARALITEGRVQAHHVFPDSGWVSFQLETPADVPFAIALLGFAGEQTSAGKKATVSGA